MAKKRLDKEKQSKKGVPAETKKAIFAIVLIVVGAFLTLAAFGAAGIAGSDAYELFGSLVGIGYFLIPLLFFIVAGSILKPEPTEFNWLKGVASVLFIVAGLGFIDIVFARGGMFGALIGAPAIKYLDIYVSTIALGAVALISLLVILEGRISVTPFIGAWNLVANFVRWLMGARAAGAGPVMNGIDMNAPNTEEEVYDDEPVEDGVAPAPRPDRSIVAAAVAAKRSAMALKSMLGTYTPPPLSLLERDRGRPGVGDIKANANIIKRTLQNFGITVELDEISIGPSVTRYAVKPAEGVRLQKILTLQKNLELALSASSIRIEAPIPGKSLVGIEVPNSSKVTVGLGTLLDSTEFSDSPKPLLIAMGRDIAGSGLFANIAKMPHALIAGATGSGKSVALHNVVTSLIYRCGPQQLRFIMIDPKRVELTLYRSLPHLLTPVITDAKRAIMALRWAGKEMQRRYDILEQERVRDIESYHQNILTPALEKLRAKGGKLEEGEKTPEAMPYIVIIIDEIADIMQSFPRELEAAIVRLAQMSRAVGIHLILSTQRPSVNVITGLIKANVPTRVALQVASQIDSRTILDQGGAESLLGAGDMLYLSSEMNKPVRLQNPYITEDEVKKVVDFIAKNNEAELPIEIAPQGTEASASGLSAASTSGSFGDEEEVDDDMYEAARMAVIEAGKASTSYIQRKLRVGYARAARLIDLLEERGVIGPGDGAKPREVLDKGGAPEPHEADINTQ